VAAGDNSANGIAPAGGTVIIVNAQSAAAPISIRRFIWHSPFGSQLRGEG
jgi:hypothetical protein